MTSTNVEVIGSTDQDSKLSVRIQRSIITEIGSSNHFGLLAWSSYCVIWGLKPDTLWYHQIPDDWALISRWGRGTHIIWFKLHNLRCVIKTREMCTIGNWFSSFQWTLLYPSNVNIRLVLPKLYLWLESKDSHHRTWQHWKPALKSNPNTNGS